MSCAAWISNHTFSEINNLILAVEHLSRLSYIYYLFYKTVQSYYFQAHGEVSYITYVGHCDVSYITYVGHGEVSYITYVGHGDVSYITNGGMVRSIT